jgi:integrase
VPKLRIRDGKYQALCYYFDAAIGKRVLKPRSTGVVADGSAQAKRTAERIARDIEGSLASVQNRKARGVTLTSALTARLAAHALAGHAADTVEITEEKLEHVLRFFGARRDVEAEPLTDEDLVAYAMHARAKRSAATVFRELVELRSALKAVGVRPPAMPNLGQVQNPKELWFTHAQSAAMYAHIPKPKRDHFVVYRMLGLSWSELYRITRADLFFDRHEVRVRGTKTKGRKINTRDRVLPMPPQVEEIMRTRVDTCAPLFPKWTYGNGHRDLSAAAVRAGLVAEGVGVSFNVLRASFCCELILAGEHLKKIALLMGHTDTKMVERWYSRLRSGEHLASAVAKIEGYGT